MNTLLRQAALFFASMLIGMTVLADDIDIYFNPPANTVTPPATIIVLDLNLIGICDDALTDSGGPTIYGGLNPLGSTYCASLQTDTLVQYLTAIGQNPTSVLTSLGPTTLCALYGSLGITAPSVLGLGCSTLAGLIGIVSSGTLSSFTTLLVNNLLAIYGSTTLTALPGTLKTTVNTALTAVPTVLVDPTSIANLNTLLNSLLTNLINSRVAIVVSHNNRSGTASLQQASSPPYACSFADMANIPSTRQATVGCSNGGYFLLGFTQLVNTASVNTVLTKVSSLITNALTNVNFANLANGIIPPGTALNPSNITPMFQEKENYDEIIHLLTADAVYNAALNSYDGVFGALARDQTIESGTVPKATYIDPSLTCRTINVLNIQATNDTGEGDSDLDLARFFPTTTLTVSGAPQQGFANLVAAAQSPGFIDSKGNRYVLNSFFLIQNTLSSIAALNAVGATVFTYTDILGLLGLGQGSPFFSTLITDASLSSVTTTSDRNSATGILPPAFFPEFHPAANQQPDWLGNVKRLDFNQVTNPTSPSYGQYFYTDTSCTDAQVQAGSCTTSAIASDGRIATGAKTYWTDTSKIGGASGDGRITYLGGAGQKIPGYVYNGGGNPGRLNASGIRQIFYDSIPTTKIPTLGALDADTASGSFNTTTNAERTELSTPLSCATTANDTTCQQLLLYARGFNVGTTASPASNLATVASRSWMMGAVLHSRPVALSYGPRNGYSKNFPDIRILFGSADGLLHMVKNGTSNTDVNAGREVWSMMPQAVMGAIKTQRDNGFSSPSNLGFPYGVDGAVSVLVIDRGTVASGTSCAAAPPADGVIDSNNPCDHAYAYFGLRRGGANYYAVDITNPDAPKMMWRIGTDGLYSANYSPAGFVSASKTSTTGWFKELGQTFSTPVAGKMLVQLSNDTTPVAHSVLLFGGGYNGSVNGTKTGKDLNNSRANGTTVSQVGQNDTIGNAIYVVEATTGELVWKAVQSSTSIASYSPSTLAFSHPLMQDSIPSDVTAVDTDGDGYTDRLYVGDTGGHVWRADFPITTSASGVLGSDRSKWTLSLVASLGRHAAASGNNTLANDRRFFEAPDYVPARDPVTRTVYDAVVIGSGDREDPFNSNQVSSASGTANFLYALRDYDIPIGKTLTATDNTGVIVSETDSRLLIQNPNAAGSAASTASNVLTALPNCNESSTSTSCIPATAITAGWQLAYSDYGEKTTSAPITTGTGTSIGGIVVLSTYVPPPLVLSTAQHTCGPTEGFSKLYALTLDYGNFYLPLQFNQDGNGDARSTAAAAPGIAGEVNAVTNSTLDVNAQTLTVSITPFFRVYWRERRGDEEKSLQTTP